MSAGNLRVGIFALALLAPGCDHAADFETVSEELAFQALHLVDTGQTLDLRHDAPRFESENAFDAGWCIGTHPKPGPVWAYMSVEAAAHAAVTVALVHYQAPRWALRVWEAASIVLEGDTVARNASLGMRVAL